MNTRIVALFMMLECPAWATEPTTPASQSRVPPANYMESIPGIKVEIPMVAIPGGTFLIGTPSSETARSVPYSRREVTLTPFWIGRNEITYSEVYRCDRAISDAQNVLHPRPNLNGPKPTTQLDRSILLKLARMREYPEQRGHLSNNADGNWNDCPNPPHTGTNQWVAKRYCHWLSIITGKFYRLPTEAEWEFACRGGAKNYDEPFPWGTSAARLSEFAITSPKLPADQGRGEKSNPPLPVGSKKPNGYGLYDMLGNAEEWVADGYAEPLPYLTQKSTTPLLDPIVWPFGKKHQWKLRHSNETEAMILAGCHCRRRPSPPNEGCFRVPLAVALDRQCLQPWSAHESSIAWSGVPTLASQSPRQCHPAVTCPMSPSDSLIRKR